MKTHKVPMDDSSLLSDIFNDSTTDQFGDRDDLFAILESLEDFNDFPPITEAVMSPTITSKEIDQSSSRVILSQKSSTTACSAGAPQDHSETEHEPAETSPKSSKRQKLAPIEEPNNPDNNGQERILSHITVERNRRKQMNEHLSVLRSLMPCFYVKRGDQASIIEGVVDYINELQQLLQCLEAKKHRKVYNEVLSPRLVVSSPRPSPLSPRKPLPPLSPRILNLPISPTTPQPQPGSPYKPSLLQQQQQQSGYLSPTTLSNSVEPSPTTSSASSSINNNNNDNNIIINELVANSKSSVADVEVKFSGPHVLLKTVSQRIPGQALRIMSTLEEELALEILHVSINSTADETMLNSFTIKIGIECQLSAEELAQQIQQTFC